MPRRSILTERQQSALFDLPTDEAAMLLHYTLADDDLEHTNERRRPENRLGFALQLCALRYPGRLLSSGEIIPEKVLRFIAAQLGLTCDDVLPYAARRQTRQQHLHALRQIYGFKMFSGQGARGLKAWLEREAETACPLQRRPGTPVRRRMPPHSNDPAGCFGHRTAMRRRPCRGRTPNRNPDCRQA